MLLIKSRQEHIAELTTISREAFDSDIAVGAAKTGGPPGYDCASWYTGMMYEGHLFTALDEGTIVGGAVIFLDKGGLLMHIGRIFVRPSYFKKRYGSAIMAHIEAMYSNVTLWKLDTPVWNKRTNCFYTKIGYKEVNRDNEFVYYQKNRADCARENRE